MSNIIGKAIGRYKIINELGRGGMATVYRAVDTLLDRNVAIKIIYPEQKLNSKTLLRFSRESKALAKLSQANIIKVLDYGEHEGSPYLVMEYIPGGTLRQKMGTPWNYVDAAKILTPLAHALSYAHDRKIVHRDIKPANILINEAGQPILSDFGILKMLNLSETSGLTGTGKIVGTPAYMSPEQVTGKTIDGRSDIYSLGIIFFEMLTGKKPYVAGSAIEIAMMHINEPLPKAKQFIRDLPEEVEKILFKCLAKKTGDRYQTMAELAKALENLYKNVQNTSTSGTGHQLPIKQHIIFRKQFWVGIPLILLLGLGVLFETKIQKITKPSAGIIETSTQSENNTVETTLTPTVVPPNNTAVIDDSPAFTPSPTEETQQPELPKDNRLITNSNSSNIIEINRLEKISVIKLEWTENGAWIVNTGSSNIFLIDPETMLITEKITLPELPISMAVSPKGDKIFVLHSTNIDVYDLQSKTPIQKFPISNGAFSLDVSHNGSLLAVGFTTNKVQILNADTGAVMRNIRSNYGGWDITFSPNDSIVALGTSQGGLMWETETGMWLPLSSGQNHIIKSIAFSKDGALLAGGGQGVVFIWDIVSGTQKLKISGTFGNVSSLDFSPDGEIIVVGAEDSSLALWDTQTGERLTELKGHSSPIYSVVFSPDGRFITSGANEGTIRLWGIP